MPYRTWRRRKCVDSDIGAMGRLAGWDSVMRRLIVGFILFGCVPFACAAGEAQHFDPDSDPSRMAWSDVDRRLGPAPDVRGERFGVVVKTLTNEYWRLMVAGYRARAASDGVKLDIQAAQSESDQIRQLAIMENMVGSGYKGLLVSPQSASNLQAAIDDAVMANVPVVDTDGAVVDSVTHFVGPVNRRMGVMVADWFIRNYPAGGQVAIVAGQADVFSTVRRSAGFRETLLAARGFAVVASVAGDWERQKAHDAALALLQQFPALIGIYCNNDTMALGVVDAVKSLHLLDRVKVFGTDGTLAAYASIKARELTGTVDIFPRLTGAIGLDIAERLSHHEIVPRVIETPEALVTRSTVDRYTADDVTLRRLLLEDAADRH